MNTILRVKEVAKTFGKQDVLKPVSFELGEGERICVLGPSGSGKSTLLQIVAGLSRADEGEIEIDGVTVERGRLYVPPERRPINMVFQDYALWPHMSVRQNIEYGMKRRKVERGDRSRRLASLQEMLKLDGLQDRLPAQLSGGQQQRVGIARALATEPKLLLMDEPLSNLDVKLRTDMRSELARLLSELSIATLYVTHDRMEAFTIADRILVLREGRIDQLGTPEELFDRPASPWVAQLMGYHNRLSVRLDDRGGAVATVADTPIRGVRMGDKRGISGGKGLMLLHPEALTAIVNPLPDAPDLLPVTAMQSIYEGTRWRIIAETADRQALHLFHFEKVAPGSKVAVYLPADRTMLYDEPNDGDDE